MSLEKAMKNLKFDSRLIEYNIANGLITHEEWQEHLNKLPDSTANSEIVKIEDSSAAPTTPTPIQE